MDPVDHCVEVRAFTPQFTSTVERFVAQDDLSPSPGPHVVFVGSSSVRRWENLALAFSDYAPLQRGMGGAQLAEVAWWADALVNRHNPRAVVVYAGTNDVDAMVDPLVVVERFRCLRQRVGQALGWDRPILFVGIAPNPARWAQWNRAQQVNAQVVALAAQDPGLVYVDVASALLATGSPPAANLFVADGLHLSAAGYAVWNNVVRTALASVVAPNAPVTQPNPPPTGTRVLLDLGPSNALDGETTPSPDHLGQAWNNWHALVGGETVLPGEHLERLVDDQGHSTPWGLVVAGSFQNNGRRNGGLLWPDQTLLGGLAVGSATGDFFYATGVDDTSGAFSVTGLDPAGHFTLRFMAAREDPERRSTRFTVTGATTATTLVQTSGAGAGRNGATTNNDTVAQVVGMQPDAWGRIFVDVLREEGSYAYLNALEIVAQ